MREMSAAELEITSGGGFWGDLLGAIGNAIDALIEAVESIIERIQSAA